MQIIETEVQAKAFARACWAPRPAVVAWIFVCSKKDVQERESVLEEDEGLNGAC